MSLFWSFLVILGHFWMIFPHFSVNFLYFLFIFSSFSALFHTFCSPFHPIGTCSQPPLCCCPAETLSPRTPRPPVHLWPVQCVHSGGDGRKEGNWEIVSDCRGIAKFASNSAHVPGTNWVKNGWKLGFKWDRKWVNIRNMGWKMLILDDIGMILGWHLNIMNDIGMILEWYWNDIEMILWWNMSEIGMILGWYWDENGIF